MTEPTGGGQAVERAPAGARTHSPEPAQSLSANNAATLPARAVGPYAVVRVVDGDTVVVARRGGTTVRLIGIDTPETVHPSRPVECFGPEASRRAHRLLDGRRVFLEFDASQGRRDAYGRTLAYLWLPAARVSVNERMVRGGYAEEYTYDNPYRYRTRFMTAERRARAADLGLWGACRASGGAMPIPGAADEPRVPGITRPVGSG